ncbi:collagen alpha-3(V) chain-like isoform X2 [Vidua chalybeata]|nr:collagen alpha-3(V) chain-like isoform X2 [Vidua chalybeata]
MSAENAAVPAGTGPETKSVVSRVANLTLVSCACGAVASAYGRTKESHPCVRSVCGVAEKGVKTLTAAAASGAQPLLTRLEPQISTANKLACKGLDKLEEKLPILQQPPERVVAGTRELVSCTVSGVVARTRSALGAVVGTRVGQLLATGVDAVLGKSEELLDRYLPGTGEELGECPPSPKSRGAKPARDPHPVAQSWHWLYMVAPQWCQSTEATVTPRRGQSPSEGHGMALGELSPGNPKANIVLCARLGIYSLALGDTRQSWPRVTAQVTAEATWLKVASPHDLVAKHPVGAHAGLQCPAQDGPATLPSPRSHSGDNRHRSGHRHRGDHGHGGDHGHRGDQGHGGDHGHRGDQGHGGDRGHRGGPAGAAEAVAELLCPRGLPVSPAATPGPAALAGGPAAGTAPCPAAPGPAPPCHPADRGGAAGHGRALAQHPGAPAPPVAGVEPAGCGAHGGQRGGGSDSGHAPRAPAPAPRRLLPPGHRCPGVPQQRAGDGGTRLARRGGRPGFPGQRPLLPGPVGPGAGTEPGRRDAGTAEPRGAAGARGAAHAPALARGTFRPRARGVSGGCPGGYVQVGGLCHRGGDAPGARCPPGLQPALSHWCH